MKPTHLILATILIAAPAAVSNTAVAAPFDTTVSSAFTAPNFVTLHMTNSAMDTSYFTNQNGGRTVYSTDVAVGTLANGNGISAHATWVIDYTVATHTVNLLPGRTHITNWDGGQRCNVYEDGTCTCGGNATWTICTRADMATYKTALKAMAILASLNAKIALTNANYIVTRN